MNPDDESAGPGLDATIADDAQVQAEREEPCVSQIGDYDILDELGRGGMGVVFKARQRSLNRIVAIKMILGQTFANEKARLRFRREAELIAALNHPNIVDIYEISEFEGQPFYSMEYIEGTNLIELIQGTPLGWTQAARFAQIIAQAMQFAHERGVIHRDLKPHNVMVDKYQNIHIMDFGLARDVNTESGLTILGTALGTPNYMSPEQCVSDATLSPATDIYAMGAIIYEMVTSIPPFLGSNVHDLLDKVKNAIPLEPRLINPSIPRDLNTICLKCLQKDPARRYLSSFELAEELDRVLKDLPIKAKPISSIEKGWRWCRRNRVLASVITGSTVLILTAAITAMVQAHLTRVALDETEIHRKAAVAINLLDSSPPQALRLVLCAAGDCIREFGAPYTDVQYSLAAALYRDREMTYVDPGYASMDDAVISGDGRRVLMAGDGKLTLFDLGSGKKLCALPANLGVQCAAIALDSKGGLIASATMDGRVRWWNSTGQPVGQLPRLGAGWVTALAFSPDGRKLATAGADLRPHLWDLQGNELPTHIADQHANPIKCLLFSPDGNLLASADSDGNGCSIQLRRLDGTLVCPPITTQNLGVTCLAFSPDGKILASGGREFASRFRGVFGPDGRESATEGVDTTVRFWNTQGLSIFPPLNQAELTVQALDFNVDGRDLVIAASSPDNPASGSVSLWSLERKTHSSLFAIPSIRAAAFGPDESLALIGNDRVCRVDTLRPFYVQSGIGEDHSGGDIAVLPEGKTIITADSINGLVSFRDFSGTQVSPPLQATTEGEAHGTRFELSPSGDLLITFVRGLPTIRLWRHQNAWTELKPIDNGAPVDGVAFSPVSGRIALGWNDQIWVRDLKGNQIARPGVDPGSIISRIAFSPDGRFFAAANVPDAIPIWDSDGRLVARIGTEGLGDVIELSFSPDAKLLAAAFADAQVTLYDMKSFRRSAPLIRLPVESRGFSDPTIVFSPDSQRIACAGGASAGGFFQIWDTKGNPLTPLVIGLPSDHRVNSACFAPSGRTLLVWMTQGTSQGLVQFMAADWQSWMDLACDRLRNHPIIQTDEIEAVRAREIIAQRLSARGR